MNDFLAQNGGPPKTMAHFLKRLDKADVVHNVSFCYSYQ